MRVNLYLLNYNNRYNKLIKRLDTLTEYLPYLVSGSSPINNITNFNFNDSVHTTQVINSWPYDKNPDYLIVEDADNMGEIHSRWFVIESDYQSNGTYKLLLHRDTIADNIDNVLNCTSYIEKGYVSNDNALVYSNENVSFNQIKKAQIPIENYARSPWVIAYLSRYHYADDGQTYEPNEFEVSYKSLNLQESLGEFPYPELLNTTITVLSEDKVDKALLTYMNYNQSANTGALVYYNIYEYIFNSTGAYNKRIRAASSTRWPGVLVNSPQNINGFIDATYNNVDNWTQAMGIINDTFLTYEDPETHKNVLVNAYTRDFILGVIKEVNGKNYTINGEVKTINITSGGIISNTLQLEIDKQPEMYNVMRYQIQPIFDLSDGDYHANKIVYNTQQITISAVSTTVGYDTKASFTFTGGNITKDAPYEIIALPYNNITWSDGVNSYTHTKELARSFIDAISSKYYANGWCYDVQLVPYIDWDSVLIDNTLIYDKGENYIIPILDSSDTPVSFAIRIEYSNFKYQLPINISMDSDIKRSINCDMYRLVSPTGNGEFEFSPVKNGGLNTVNIECSLIPRQVYINVCPVFGNLYGDNFNDFRGLICGGDFGLPILSNEWSQYMLNNKNYQEIFDRQIATMDYNNKYNKLQQGIGLGVNSLSGVAGGAAIGSAILPGIGTAVGGVLGGIASLGGGVADYSINQKLYKRQREDTELMFDWSLGNIKARANTLARATSFNIDTQFFPYIEYYTCTDEEKRIFDRILKHQGMTVNSIDSIINYMNFGEEWTYIKAIIIDININDETALIEDINQQLQGGIRISYVNTAID